MLSLNLHFLTPETQVNKQKNKLIKKEINFAGRKLILETGELASLANTAVKVTYGDTVVLATAVSGGLNPDVDYFPLSIVYEEKLYASGSIKSSRFVKRDGRPTEAATVTRRLIDHAVRPLFPNDFKDNVQVVITVLSLDEDADPEFVAMTAASAALHASDIPWTGPMVSAQVGYDGDDYMLNPTKQESHENSSMEMMVSFVGQEKKFLAIEATIDILPNKKVLGAIEFARNSLDPILELISDFAQEVNPGNTKYEYESQALDDEVFAAVKKETHEDVKKIFDGETDGKVRMERRNSMLEKLYEKFEGEYKKTEMEEALFLVEKKTIQENILKSNKRPDGRALTELRPISSKVSILPRTHGSALFNRGETQALTIATLGSPSEELLIQDMYGERSKKYIHYYNFPPFSTGEVGRIGSPGGREIGHGMLAEKALIPVLPDQTEFPYVIILVSEILASNGSTSMAAACGSTLALMDAGVPIKDMVAGISVGLVADEENDDYILLTDIMGLEDWTGHMDFKIAGTKDGITAIQLDMKVKGIPMELLPKIFEHSLEARQQILDTMSQTIDTPNGELSKYAPKMLTIKVKPEQVGMVIGSGGKTIRELQEKSSSDISIEEDGTVFIASPNLENAQIAYDMIEGMTKELVRGEVYDGEVVDILDFGALVQLFPGKTGLLHISELDQGFVKNVTDYVNKGDKVTVKVIDIGREGKFSLSIKALKSDQ